jgi:hypothetical protein
VPSVAERLRAIVGLLPDGAAVTLPADAVRVWLEDEPGIPAPVAIVAEPETWRCRLWTCPADTRLGVRELAEALDRSPDWVYRATNRKLSEARGRAPLPCSRLDGVLVFTAQCVRRWLPSAEEIVNPEPPTTRRHLRRTA